MKDRSAPLHVSHLADGSGVWTVCGEPWQSWQEPDAYRRKGEAVVVVPAIVPKVTRVRPCMACQLIIGTRRSTP